MLNPYMAVCLLLLYLICIVSLIIGERIDKKREKIVQHLKRERASYTMQVKRNYCITCFLIGLFAFTPIAMILLLNGGWGFVALSSILLGWAVIFKLVEAIVNFCWKVVVNGDQFTVYGLVKNGQTFSFNDICYARESKRFANRFCYRYEYEVIVGESPAMKSVVFSLYDKVIGYDIFISRLKSLGKIKKDPTVLG